MTDVIIIGGGVSGCAAARELSRYRADILLVDKAEDVCCGTTKANSAIVHAGFDAPAGSRMAALNVAGSRRMPELRQRAGFSPTGSAAVWWSASARRTAPPWRNCWQTASPTAWRGCASSNAPSCVPWNPILPTRAVAALWAPTGGIVCPFGLTYALAENARQKWRAVPV